MFFFGSPVMTPPQAEGVWFHLSEFQNVPWSKVAFFLGTGMHLPPFNDGILISWGPINPYGLGLMSLSPIGNDGS